METIRIYLNEHCKQDNLSPSNEVLLFTIGFCNQI